MTFQSDTLYKYYYTHSHRLNNQIENWLTLQKHSWLGILVFANKRRPSILSAMYFANECNLMLYKCVCLEMQNNAQRKWATSFNSLSGL